MRAYRVAATDNFVATDGAKTVAWAGSQSDAAKHKARLMEELGAKRNQIESEEIDIPTNKVELLAFLNGL